MKLFFENLDQNPDKAAEKYVSLHRRLARFFNRHGLPAQDAEDAASEVMMRVNRNLNNETVGLDWKAPQPDSQQNKIELYCFGVAKNLRHEIYREFSRKGELPETLPAFDDPAKTRFIEQQFQMVRKCIEAAVPAADRDWFEQYAKADYGEKRLIAAARDISEETLRVRYHRLLKKVRACCQKRFYEFEAQTI